MRAKVIRKNKENVESLLFSNEKIQSNKGKRIFDCYGNYQFTTVNSSETPNYEFSISNLIIDNNK